MKRSRRHCLQVLWIPTILLGFGGSAGVAENIDPGNLGLKYAYGENIGWINFSPVAAGVLNDRRGRHAGYAWGENVGWINFAPAGAGVFIDYQGARFGKAWGENVGWISFDSSGAVPFGVTTSYLGQYSQTPLGIPTLSEWGLLALCVLLGAIGTLVLKRRAVLQP